MSLHDKILQKKRKLKLKYLSLIEEAYNYRQTDHGYSDLSEFKAIKVLNRINELKFVVKDNQYRF